MSLIQQDRDVLAAKPSVQQLRQKFTAADSVAYAKRVRSVSVSSKWRDSFAPNF